MFHSLISGKRKIDTIIDCNAERLDVIDIGDSSRIARQFLDNGVWHLQLKDDGTTIKIEVVTDANGDGKIVDDLLIVSKFIHDLRIAPEAPIFSIA